MLILKTLALEPMHGYGIGVRLEQISKGVLQVNAGSLFPAFRRLERDGLIKAEWRTTENNRRAKCYALTAEAAPGSTRAAATGRTADGGHRAGPQGSHYRGRVMRSLRAAAMRVGEGRSCRGTRRGRRSSMPSCSAYLACRRRRNIAAGMSHQERGARGSRLTVGSLSAIRVRVRDRRVGRSRLEGLWRDVRHAVRGLRRSPAFPRRHSHARSRYRREHRHLQRHQWAHAPVVAGRGPPNRLVTISSAYTLGHGFTAGVGWNYGMWQRLQERVGVFGGALAWTDGRFNLAQGGEKDIVDGLFTDGGFFTTLGVPA